MNKITLKTVAESQRKLIALVMEHNGSNGTAHLAATQDQAGFESATDKMLIETRGNQAAGLDANKSYDILKDLGFGLYFGNNFKNAPMSVNNSCLVRISGWRDFKHIEFTQLNAGLTWTRDIYTDAYDSGWTQNTWVKIVPINGFSGRIAISRLREASHSLIDIRVDITGNYERGGPVDIGTLPSSYTSLDPNRIGFVGIGFQASGAAVPVGLYIHNGNKIGLIRLDNDTASAATITGILAQDVFLQSDSTV